MTKEKLVASIRKVVVENWDGLSQLPDFQYLFTSKELAQMQKKPYFRRKARLAIVYYTQAYNWDGVAKDSRYAYVCGKHDYEGTKVFFREFWEYLKKRGR